MAEQSMENELEEFVGQPWWGATRAASMLMLSFGRKHEQTDRHGQVIERGAIALHVQCPWRLSDEEGILVGSDDLTRPPDDQSSIAIDSGPDSPTQADAALDALLADKGPLIVSGVEADRLGGVRIDFHDGFRLELFPASTEAERNAEYWRFFHPDSDEAHLVVSARGAERV